MAITISAVPGAWQAGTGALTVPAPAATVANDLLLIIVSTANAPVATPSGWNVVPNTPVSTGTLNTALGTRLTLFWRWQNGTITNAVLSDTGFNHREARMVSFNGVDQNIPFDVTPTTDVHTTAVSAITFPAVTTITNGAFILNIDAMDQDTNASGVTAITTMANTDLSNFSKIIAQTVNTGTGGGIALLYGTDNVAGSVKSSTATASSTGAHAMATLALRPVTTPALDIPSASNISYNSATISGSVTSLGGDVSASVIVEYGLTASYGSTVSSSSLSAPGSYSADLTGLTRNKIYHYRVNVTNSVGTTYSNDATFTLLISTRPVVEAISVTDITETSATLKANLISFGEPFSQVNFYGFEYGIDTGYGYSAQLGTKSTLGEFQATIEGLDPETEYLWYAYANNSFSMGASAVGLFATSVPVTAVLGTASFIGRGDLEGIGSLVVSGIASLTGAGELSATGSITKLGDAFLMGQGELIGSGIIGLSVPGTATLTGSGALSGTGVNVISGAATIVGTGTLSATGTKVVLGTSDIIGTSTLSGTGISIQIGTASLTGAGELSATGIQIIISTAALNGSADLSASGEAISWYSVITGNASLLGAGALSATGIPVPIGEGTLTGRSDLLVEGTRIVLGSANFISTGILSGVGGRITLGTSEISGTGVLSGNGECIVVSVVNVDGRGDLSGIGTSTICETATLAGIGILTSEAENTVASTANLTGFAVLGGAGIINALGMAQLTGTAILEGNGMAIILASADLTGSGVLESVSEISIIAEAANFTGAGILSGGDVVLQTIVIATIDQDLNLRVLKNIIEGGIINLSPDGILTITHLIESPGVMRIETDGTLIINQIIEGVV
jgi:fibronectin-binding autotransporter adhesin